MTVLRRPTSRAVPASLLLLAVGLSPALAQQISQSPLIAHKAGAACAHGPHPSPAGADNVNGYGIAGCLPGGSRDEPMTLIPGEAAAARRAAPPASTAVQVGLFSVLHNIER